MPLQTSYRPEKLEEFAGNDALVESLATVLERKTDEVHTFLFTGPSGCGKTTLANIVALELQCSERDLTHINASDLRGIDTVREVIDMSRYAPGKGQVRVFMFEECHNLTKQAQEALLDATEKPPPHVYYIFCTTEPDKLKDTFQRRAFVGEVKPLPRKQMTSLLKDIIAEERIEDFPEIIIDRVVAISNGSPGIALKHLDSVIDVTDEALALEHLDTVYVSETVITELCQVLIDTKLTAKKKWKKLKPMLAEDKLTAEPEIVRKAVLTYIQKVLLGESGRDAEIASIIACFCEPYHYTYRAGMVMSFYLACQTMEEIEGHK